MTVYNTHEQKRELLHMQPVVTGSLLLLFIVFAIYRRLRPQPVRPRRAAIQATLIIILSLLSLFSTNTLFTHMLALVLALPALIIGLATGFLLMRSIHFWRDATTGVLWMKGGVIYIAVWLATVFLREGAAYASGAFSGGKTTFTVNPTITALAADLILFSIGLWIARTIALVRKYRAYMQSPRPQMPASDTVMVSGKDV